MNIAARATCAPGCGSAHAEVCAPRGDRRAEHPVVRRVVLDLVEAEAPAVVRVGDGGVDVGELGVALERRRADELARLAQRVIRPAGAEGVDGGAAAAR